MSLSTSGRTWEEASSPAAVLLARRFESAFRDSCGRRPEPDEFLPDDPSERAGARLALLRADLTLRWESGEKVSADWYRERYSDLDEETLVALVYEEFCLREEAQQEPEPADFLARYPALASRLRRVFDIHGLVGSGQGTASSTGAETPAIPFPEAGQTIAGFHLVEELGRGAFARVFLARERQLADRPVALKVSRTGSREPQTLARLQHTHIVPIHSYRVDQATGLHLLCMPYFGRVTLSRLMADSVAKVARSGSELLEVLDRLGGREERPTGRSASRLALAGRTYAQAIAWWGARMAEALALAHDHGVLHRDIKPSNVLLNADGMPMLLDFNLARETLTDGGDLASRLGGTLDYMAPEHLDELAEGVPGRVDARSDVYSLGVLLYEALAGVRPFAAPQGALTAGEVLVRAAQAKRGEPPWLTDDHPEVPAPLEAIVRRCLQPDPDERYAMAGDLAFDLQAVADDRPLRFAREPLSSRVVRWTRRNRRALAVAMPVLLAVAALVGSGAKYVDYKNQKVLEVTRNLERGKDREKDGKLDVAVEYFNEAARQSAGLKGLEDLNKEARAASALAGQALEARRQADSFLKLAEPLRFRLLGFGGDLEATSRDLLKTLKPFFVFETGDWTKQGRMSLLDETRHREVVEEVNQLLFMWAVALDAPRDSHSASQVLPICEKALTFAEPRQPWIVFRDRLQARTAKAPEKSAANNAMSASSALGCFEWGFLCEREESRGAAIEWLRRAVDLKSNDYWYQYYLAFLQDERAQTLPLLDRDRAEAIDGALAAYNTALGLKKSSPEVRFSRARLYGARNAWQFALADLDLALAAFHELPEDAVIPGFESMVRLERGFVYQRLGRQLEARKEYAVVIDANPWSHWARAARLNRAKLEADAGAPEKARAEYDWLLKNTAPVSERDDPAARLGLAMLALQLGDLRIAESELTELLSRRGAARADLLTYRAQACLAAGQPSEAAGDIAEALRLEPTPGRVRLQTRILLASHQAEALQLDRPGELTRLPLSGRSLRSDLRRAAGLLAPRASGNGAAALRARLNRAVLFSALHDRRAEAEANRAAELAPLTPEVFLIRARIRQRRGDWRGALADVEQGLVLDRRHAPLWELRGLLMVELGNPQAGLDDLNHALASGGSDSFHGARAVVLDALGDPEGAVREWNRALSRDPEDPRAFLGRARALIRLRLWDQALANLEQASEWAGEDAPLHAQIGLTMLRCVPERRQQLSRAIAHLRRAWEVAQAARVVRDVSINP